MISQLMRALLTRVGEVGWEGIEVSLDQPQWSGGDSVWSLKRCARGGIRSD